MVIISRIKNLLNGVKENRKKAVIIQAINDIRQKKFKYAVMEKQTKRIVFSSKTYYPSIDICKKHANAHIGTFYDGQYDKYLLLYYPVLIDENLNGEFEICENGVKDI